MIAVSADGSSSQVSELLKPTAGATQSRARLTAGGLHSSAHHPKARWFFVVHPLALDAQRWSRYLSRRLRPYPRAQHRARLRPQPRMARRRTLYVLHGRSHRHIPRHALEQSSPGPGLLPRRSSRRERWSLGGSRWISAVAEGLNVTVQREVISGEQVGPITIPSVGIEGGF